jgi:hypothetical protein
MTSAGDAMVWLLILVAFGLVVLHLTRAWLARRGGGR